MNGQLIGKVAPTTRGANRVNVAENVGDRNVGSSKFLDVTLVARQPGNGRIVALGSQAFAASAANGSQRMVVDFAPCDHRNFRVQKLHQAAQDTAFGLATQSKENEIVAGQQGVHDLRNDAVVVSMHAGK